MLFPGFELVKQRIKLWHTCGVFENFTVTFKVANFYISVAFYPAEKVSFQSMIHHLICNHNEVSGSYIIASK